MGSTRGDDLQHYRKLNRGLWIGAYVLLKVAGSTIFALVFGWAVLRVWNWLIPGIFGIGAIHYWQAFGLVILVPLIIGSLRRRDSYWRSLQEGSRTAERAGKWEYECRLHLVEHFFDFLHDEDNEVFVRYSERRQGEAERPPGELLEFSDRPRHG